MQSARANTDCVIATTSEAGLDYGFSSLALQRFGKNTFARPRWMPEDNSVIDLRIRWHT